MPSKKTKSEKTEKPVKKSEPKAKQAKAPEPKVYFEAVGRRKTSSARVRLQEGNGSEIIVNSMDFRKYFPTEELQRIVEDPFKRLKLEGLFSVSIKVSGGGIHSQSEAVRHGISRALLKYDAESRKRLKRAGFLKRDPRMKERRKFGLKKARKAPQWSKR